MSAPKIDLTRHPDAPPPIPFKANQLINWPTLEVIDGNYWLPPSRLKYLEYLENIEIDRPNKTVAAVLYRLDPRTRWNLYTPKTGPVRPTPHAMYIGQQMAAQPLPFQPAPEKRRAKDTSISSYGSFVGNLTE